MEPHPDPAPPVGSFGSVAARVWRATDRRRQRQFVGALLLMGIAGVAELATIGSLMPLLALLVERPGAAAATGLGVVKAIAGQSSLLPVAIACLIAASLAAGAMRLALLHVTNRLAFGLGHDIGKEIFRRMLRQPYSLHVARNPSEVIAGIDKVHILIFSALLPMMQGLVALVLALSIVAALTVIAPLPTVIAAALVAIAYLVLSLGMGRRLSGNSEVIARMATARTKALREGLGALRDILVGQAQGEFETRFNALDLAYRRAQAENAFITGAPRVVLESCGIAMLGLVALCFSATPGGVLAALPILGALGFGAVRILPLINTAYVGWSLFAGNRRAFSDVLRLLETPMVPEGAANAQIAFEREISFRQVSLRYPARGYALRDVSLRITRGAWTALWGPTGSGKSSVLDLASGLIAPSAGIILIDDVPLDGTTQAAWQAMIAHVPQTVYLTDGSIGANIAFGVPEAQVDRARLRDAVERAQLAEFVASLPEGLDTWVGDAGIRLSGGQRQRIAIARALYRRSRLIILDEATGQLDRETEHMVIETLRNGVGEAVTVLVVTHNPAVLERCDHVIELHRGRVVGQAG